MQQQRGAPTRAAGANVIQRAPAAKTSPDDEKVRGAMAYLSQISSTYVQVAGGKRVVADSEVTSQINLMTGVYNKAEATLMGGTNPSGGVPQLRATYQEALGNVVNASARTTGRTANEIYLKHESEIPEWAMPHITDPKISTPLPLDAKHHRERPRQHGLPRPEGGVCARREAAARHEDPRHAQVRRRDGLRVHVYGRRGKEEADLRLHN